jgi:hypothetical protein
LNEWIAIKPNAVWLKDIFTERSFDRNFYGKGRLIEKIKFEKSYKILYGCQFVYYHSEELKFQRKNLAFFGIQTFKPMSSGFQIGIVTNWAIQVGNRFIIDYHFLTWKTVNSGHQNKWHQGAKWAPSDSKWPLGA